jgi:hypothetical protein
MIWFEPEPGAVAVAVQIGGVAIRGNKLAIVTEIDCAPVDVWESTLWALLRLYDQLSRSLRTGEELFDLHARLIAIAVDDDHMTRRLGSSLLAAYAQVVDAESLGSNELRWHAMGELNAAVADADRAFADIGLDGCFALVLAAALTIWHDLLPEISPSLIQATAAELWSN